MPEVRVGIIGQSSINRQLASRRRAEFEPTPWAAASSQHEAATAAECWVIHKKNQNPERSERVAACHGVGRKPGDGRRQQRIEAEASAAHSLRRGSYKILRLPRVPPHRGSTRGYCLSPAKAGSELRSPLAHQSRICRCGLIIPMRCLGCCLPEFSAGAM